MNVAQWLKTSFGSGQQLRLSIPLSGPNCMQSTVQFFTDQWNRFTNWLPSCSLSQDLLQSYSKLRCGVVARCGSEASYLLHIFHTQAGMWYQKVNSHCEFTRKQKGSTGKVQNGNHHFTAYTTAMIPLPSLQECLEFLLPALPHALGNNVAMMMCVLVCACK